MNFIAPVLFTLTLNKLCGGLAMRHTSKLLGDVSISASYTNRFVTKWCSVNYITRLTTEDFVRNNLSFAIEYYNNNIYVAISSGYAGMSFDDWRRLTAFHMNRKLVEDKLNRECILNGLKRFSSSVYAIRYENFEACGISYVLDYYRSKRHENLSDKSVFQRKTHMVCKSCRKTHLISDPKPCRRKRI